MSKALREASAHGNTDTVRDLLRGGASVDGTNKKGYTALMRAANTGKAQVVRVLLNAKANVNLSDKGGWTALMRAAENNHLDCVAILVGIDGVDLKLKNADGATALFVALHFKSFGCARKIAGAAPTTTQWPAELLGPDTKRAKAALRTSFERTEAKRVASAVLNSDPVRVMELLLTEMPQRRFELMRIKERRFGFTALTAATFVGSYGVVQQLLVAKAQIDHQDRAGNTALHWAYARGQFHLVQLLTLRWWDSNAFSTTNASALKPRQLAQLMGYSGQLEEVDRVLGGDQGQSSFNKLDLALRESIGSARQLLMKLKSVAARKLWVNLARYQDEGRRGFRSTLPEFEPLTWFYHANWARHRSTHGVEGALWGRSLAFLLDQGANINSYLFELGHRLDQSTTLIPAARLYYALSGRQSPSYESSEFASWKSESEVRDRLKKLVDLKGSIGLTGFDGRSPIHEFANEPDALTEKVLIELLAAKARINAQNCNGFTPLYCAASMGHGNVVKLLLATKANINAAPRASVRRNGRDCTPLYEAAIKGREHAVRELVLAKALVDWGRDELRLVRQTSPRIANMLHTRKELTIGAYDEGIKALEVWLKHSDLAAPQHGQTLSDMCGGSTLASVLAFVTSMKPEARADYLNSSFIPKDPNAKEGLFVIFNDAMTEPNKFLPLCGEFITYGLDLSAFPGERYWAWHWALQKHWCSKGFRDPSALTDVLRTSLDGCTESRRFVRSLTTRFLLSSFESAPPHDPAEVCAIILDAGADESCVGRACLEFCKTGHEGFTALVEAKADLSYVVTCLKRTDTMMVAVRCCQSERAMRLLISAYAKAPSSAGELRCTLIRAISAAEGTVPYRRHAIKALVDAKAALHGSIVRAAASALRSSTPKLQATLDIVKLLVEAKARVDETNARFVEDQAKQRAKEGSEIEHVHYWTQLLVTLKAAAESQPTTTSESGGGGVDEFDAFDVSPSGMRIEADDAEWRWLAVLNLIRAIDTGSDLDVTSRLDEAIRAKAPLDAALSHKWTALSVASAKGREQIVERLVKLRASVNHRTRTGMTALRAAFESASQHSIAVMRKLIDLKANPNIRIVDDEHMLHRAASIDRSDALKLLLQCDGVEIDAANGAGETALMFASGGRSGDKVYSEAISLLVTKGAAVDARTHTGESALHFAAAAGHREGVKLLLDHNASVAVLNTEKRSPLMGACKRNDAELLRLLLRECDPSVAAQIAPDGASALRIASRRGLSELVDLLLDPHTIGQAVLRADVEGLGNRNALELAKAFGRKVVVPVPPTPPPPPH